jgi:hypothetical protein
MEGTLMCHHKPCKSEGHKKCLRVKPLHQPIFKSDKSLWQMNPKGIALQWSQKIVLIFFKEHTMVYLKQTFGLNKYK